MFEDFLCFPLIEDPVLANKVQESDRNLAKQSPKFTLFSSMKNLHPLSVI